MSHFFKKEPNVGRWGNHCKRCQEGVGGKAGNQGTEFTIGWVPRRGGTRDLSDDGGSR